MQGMSHIASQILRDEYKETAVILVWKWVMRQIKHAFNTDQIIFLYWAFHDDTAIGSDGQSYEFIMRGMMDKVYDGAATNFVLQFWDSNGNDVGDAWLELYRAVQNMIIDLKSFINDKNDSCINGDDNINNNKANRKRKRQSADQQDLGSPSRKRRRSSLTF